jgi:hypothetical protein
MIEPDSRESRIVTRLTPFPRRLADRDKSIDDFSGGGILEFVSVAESNDLAREATFKRLAELVRSADPVPSEVVAAAKESFTWRSIDEELAELVYDSTFDGDLLAGVRAGGTVGRQLTFEAPGLVLEVEVLDGPDRELTCQIVPPQPATLELRHRNGSICLERDDFGMFHMTEVPVGPVSLRCVPLEDGHDPASTSWVTF